MADTTQVANGQLSEHELCRPSLGFDIRTLDLFRRMQVKAQAGKYQERKRTGGD
ncbi:hypothetical protein [Paraburkholderia youngii]|uniref:hypothetical protein n=1 Tax=Paraburkholderia youngii TaxID=2782701 RepID=UPI003D21DA39